MADLILEIVEGDDAGRQTPLEGSIEIGREASTGLPIDDEQASRRHTRVTAEGDHALVEDLGSTNGTYLNGQPIEGQRTLRPGDRLRVGLTIFELRTAADVQRQPSAVIPVPQFTKLSGDVLEPVPSKSSPEPAAIAEIDADWLRAERHRPSPSRSPHPGSCRRRWRATRRRVRTTPRWRASWIRPSSGRRASRPSPSWRCPGSR